MSSEDNGWKDSLPEDLKETTLVQEAPNIEAIVKTAVHGQRMLGNSIRLPGEDASDDDKAEFRQKAERFGLMPKEGFIEWVRPKEAEQYKIDEAPTDAEEIGLTQGMVDGWKAQAHAMGLSPEQFQSFAAANIEAVRNASAAQRELFEGADAKLTEKWGEAAFKARKDMALAALQKFSPELAERMGAQPDPDVLIAFAEIGKQFNEMGTGDLTPKPVYTETREEAATRLAEIMSNENHPFHHGPMGPGGRTAYEAAAAEVIRLRAISMGQTPPKAGGDIMYDATG